MYLCGSFKSTLYLLACQVSCRILFFICLSYFVFVVVFVRRLSYASYFPLRLLILCSRLSLHMIVPSGMNPVVLAEGKHRVRKHNRVHKSVHCAHKVFTAHTDTQASVFAAHTSKYLLRTPTHRPTSKCSLHTLIHRPTLECSLHTLINYTSLPQSVCCAH